MATPSKLAVILHADVVGSTALVQQDEHVAHARFQEAFRQLASNVAAYGGVTHELRGDADQALEYFHRVAEVDERFLDVAQKLEQLTNPG